MSIEPIEGLAEVDDFLNQLPQRIAKAAVQRVLRRAAQVIAAKWFALARVRTREQGHGPKGRFKASIRVSSAVERSMRKWPSVTSTAPAAVAYVGPTAMGYPEAMEEEFGAHSNHHNEAANAPGRRAWDSEAQAALNVIASEMGPELEKTVARYAKRTAGR